MTLAKLAALGAEAAVTGLAIYSGALDLRQAIQEVELGTLSVTVNNVEVIPAKER